MPTLWSHVSGGGNLAIALRLGFLFFLWLPALVLALGADITDPSASGRSDAGNELLALLGLMLVSVFTWLALHLPVIGWLLFLVLVPFWGGVGLTGDASRSTMVVFVLLFPVAKWMTQRNAAYWRGLRVRERMMLRPRTFLQSLQNCLLATAGGPHCLASYRSGNATSSAASNDNDRWGGSGSGSGHGGSGGGWSGGGGSSGGGGASGSW